METKQSLVLLYNAVVVTMDQDFHVIRDGAVAILGDRIKAVGPTAQILAEFFDEADESLDLNGRFILPGTVTCFLPFGFGYNLLPYLLRCQYKQRCPDSEQYSYTIYYT
jgi:imidazolonepropionase-like amidohydrolase